MNPLEEVMGRIMRQVGYMEDYERPPIPDDEVAVEIERLYDQYGYIPSPESIEAVRAFMGGYGILLSGPAGVGKTMLFNALGIRIYTATKISTEFGIRGLTDFHEMTAGCNIGIDDLGVERVASEYGAKDDVLKTLIAYRAERTDALTHVTTNLTSDEISERYGDRTVSRLMGMCKPFKLTGTSRREPKPQLRT